MAKPSILPRWGDTAAPADVVAPNSSKQGSGWSNGELPPHTYFNWWQNLVFQWIQWLNGLLDTANTWTARQSFNGGCTVPASTPGSSDAARRSEVDAADTAEATTRAAADTAEATARANADALLMPKTGGTFTGAVAMPSLNAPAGGALAIGTTDDHATTLNRNGIQGLSLDADAQGDDQLALHLGSATHINGVREPLFGDWAAPRSYVDAVPRFVVAGRVRSDGLMMSQTGIITASSVPNGTGAYTVTVPGLTSGAIVVASQHSSPNYAISAIPGSGSFIVNVAIPNASAQNSDFSFVVLKL